MAEHLQFFLMLLLFSVAHEIFIIPAAVLVISGLVSTMGAARAEGPPPSGAAIGGILFPAYITIGSLAIATYYRGTGDYMANVAIGALFTLQLPLVAYLSHRMGRFWLFGLCLGLAQLWFACIGSYVAMWAINS